jgi:maleate isomerase
LAAFGLGCTGSSYIAGFENEENFTSKAYNETSVPVITAAQAIRKALERIGCSSIALVSPYPDWLAELGYEYWELSGLKIMDRLRVDPSLTNTHRIYELSSQDALDQMRKLKETEADCILASGTGMPTLRAIRTLGSETGIPVLSSNLSLAWALTMIVSPEQAPHLPQDLL